MGVLRKSLGMRIKGPHVRGVSSKAGKVSNLEIIGNYWDEGAKLSDLLANVVRFTMVAFV